MILPLVPPHVPSCVASTPLLCLFAGPYLTVDGARVDVPEGSKRLLAFVTLRGGSVNRRQAAGTLWPCAGDERAAGNLRSALWRLKGAGIDVLRSDKATLQLDAGLRIDVEELGDWADRVIAGRALPSDLCVVHSRPEAVELLPGWYDDWVVFERERLRQRMLHALESLTCCFTREGRYADAVDTAMTAIGVEPLRESAHRVLILAHLAEHNWVEAERAFAEYRQLVQDELGVSPSRELAALIGPHDQTGDARPPRQRDEVPTALSIAPMPSVRRWRTNERNALRVP